ncbi:ClbS/DfsB family four-helix bundle protein [bacterium]|nr:MAG: ClbS/DfsB family four-helix bundle protein [bacterium]
MPTKTELLSSLQTVQDEILQLSGSLTESERNVSGAPDNWGPRDVLAHLSEAKRNWASDLAAARRGETPPQGDQPERSNQAIYEAYASRPWSDIANLIECAHQEVLDQVQPFSDDELNDPDHFAWMGGAPIWRRTAGLCFIHATVHLFQTHMARDNQESARRIARLEKELALALDASDRWVGMVDYNQGCYHALFGEKEMALRELEKSFRLSPQFIEFSLQDTDLVSLHEDPDFLALRKQ